MSELKPCPFCGGEATLRADILMRSFWVECDTCGCKYQKRTYTEELLIEAWNTRADLDKVESNLDKNLVKNGGWIPCKKALPPVTKIYLVTKKQKDDGELENDCQRFYAGASKWDCELYENDWKVIAWQDAPEPRQRLRKPWQLLLEQYR